MLKIEPSFVYDDFEEVWESNKGVFIETDAETLDGYPYIYQSWISKTLKIVNGKMINCTKPVD